MLRDANRQSRDEGGRRVGHFTRPSPDPAMTSRRPCRPSSTLRPGSAPLSLDPPGRRGGGRRRHQQCIQIKVGSHRAEQGSRVAEHPRRSYPARPVKSAVPRDAGRTVAHKSKTGVHAPTGWSSTTTFVGQFMMTWTQPWDPWKPFLTKAEELQADLRQGGP